MYVAAIFDMEIQNGGLCQFLVNCGSSYVAKVTESLGLIGLEPMGTLYETFRSDYQIDSDTLSFFQSSSIDEYILLSERYPFDGFDNAYMELWKKIDFSGAMIRYANAYAEVFLKP